MNFNNFLNVTWARVYFPTNLDDAAIIKNMNLQLFPTHPYTVTVRDDAGEFPQLTPPKYPSLSSQFEFQNMSLVIASQVAS